MSNEKATYPRYVTIYGVMRSYGTRDGKGWWQASFEPKQSIRVFAPFDEKIAIRDLLNKWGLGARDIKDVNDYDAPPWVFVRSGYDSFTTLMDEEFFLAIETSLPEPRERGCRE